MEATKPTIRENLLRAIELVENEPAPLVNLEKYVNVTVCGTLHCTGGLCAIDPFFQAQGMRLNDLGWLETEPSGFPTRDLESLFGPKAWGRLFAIRGEGTWDQGWLNPDDGPITNKELALLRLRKQLEEYPE